MFLLVLGRLPDRFAEGPSWAPRRVRILLSAAVGAAVAAFAMVVSVSRTAPSVGDDYLARYGAPKAAVATSVNVTLVDFRGFDTQGEITVLAVAAVGVVNIVGVARREQRRKRLARRDRRHRPDRPRHRRHRPGRPMRPSTILTTTAPGLTPVLLLVSLFVTFRGHNAPGGGFAGGLIMGTAVVLRYLAEGRPGIRSIRLDPVALIAAGLGLALATSTAPLLFGSQFMDSELVDLDLPLIGEIHFVTAGIFDIGVHVLVVGVVMAILIAFARADDEATRAGSA